MWQARGNARYIYGHAGTRLLCICDEYGEVAVIIGFWLLFTVIAVDIINA